MGRLHMIVDTPFGIEAKFTYLKFWVSRKQSREEKTNRMRPEIRDLKSEVTLESWIE